MPIINSKNLDEKYERLKLFFGLFVDWYFPKLGKPEDHPLKFIANLERESYAKAKRSLLMGVNDIVESSLDWKAERVADADARFASADSPTLSEIRRDYSKRYSSILKKGEIKSEVEYFMVKGIRDSCGPADEDEYKKIENLLIEYESMAAKKSNP